MKRAAALPAPPASMRRERPTLTTLPASGRPRRVLHLLSTLERGGTEMALLRLLPRMDPAAWSFRVAWLHGPGDLAPAFAEACEAVPTCLDLRFKADLRVLPRLVDLVRREGIDLVQTHMDLADYYGAAAARLTGRHLVSIRQNADEFRTRRTWKRPPFLLLEQLSYAAADAVVAVSEGLVDFLARAEGLPRHKTVVIPNGVDESLAARAPEQAAARRALGLPSGGPIVGTVGRLAQQKGQVYLLQAFPEILRERPEARLVLAGEGPERPRLEAEACRLGIDGRVIFLGHRDDVPTVLAALDQFAFPSLWEGMPMALIEAMLLERPVVAARGVGMDELVSDGITGLVVEPRDPAGTARALLRLLRDPREAARMGEAARRRVLDRHGLGRVAGEFDRLYRRVLGGGR
ncbi:MAG TPA: glycosyltransferase [Candidatus Polarisedimenticolia bacterium]|nr:glycosyltransferase [Candidatus Polarisedimenticolia bacterium]